MTCFHPITIHLIKEYPIEYPQLCEKEQKQLNKPKFRGNDKTYAIQIPCGHCIGCRLDKANDWATRINVESRLWKNNLFLTLTYNEHGKRKENRDLAGQDNLPRTITGKMTLRLQDLQNFMKRLRNYAEKTNYENMKSWINPITLKNEKPIRYFACGEYGPKGGRPHYHMALFNWKPNDLKFYKLNKQGQPLFTSQTLQEIWGHGFVVIGELTQKSACYIARYTQKKAGQTKSENFYIYDSKTQTKKLFKSSIAPKNEFIVMSRGCGIGRKWWDEQKEFVKKWGYISIKIDDKVKQKPIPHYFKKLWEKEDWEDYHIHRYENIKKAIIKMNEMEKLENYEKGDWEYLSRIRQEQILLQKAQTLRRNNFI